MECRHVRDLLDLYEEGSLDAATRRDVARHLEGCPDCRAELAALRGVRERLLTLNADDRTVDVRDAVMAGVLRQRGPLAAVPRPLLLAAVAGLLLAAVLAYPPARAQAAELVRGVFGVVAYMRSVVQGGGTAGDAAAGPPEIAFVDPDGTVWLAKADGTDRRKLAEGCTAPWTGLVWSPDGSKLACTGDRLRIIDVRGGILGEISDASYLGWSPDGRYLAVGTPRREPTRLRLVEPDGTPVAESPIDSPLWMARPIWAHDAPVLAYMPEPGTVVFLNAATGERRQMDVPGLDLVLAWALDDGKLVVGAGYRRPNPDGPGPTFYEAHLLDVTAGEPTRFPALDNGVQFWPSPDGRLAAYRTVAEDEVARGEVAILDLVTGDRVIIPGSELRYGSEGIPPEHVWFSPDGRQVYWLNEPSGPRAVYRANVDGTGLERLWEAPEPRTGRVRFSPDMRRLAYTEQVAGSGPDARFLLWTADADGTDAVKIGESGWAFAWRPGGDEGAAADGAVTTDCPIDPAACGFAARLDAWVQAGDVDAIVAHMEPEEFECPGPGEGGPGSPFPLCEGAAAGERRTGLMAGRLFSEGGAFTEEGMAEHLRSWLADVDPGAADEFGPGAVRLYSLSCPWSETPQIEGTCETNFVVAFSALLRGDGAADPIRQLLLFPVKQPSGAEPAVIDSVITGFPVPPEEGFRAILLEGGDVPDLEFLGTFYPWRPAGE